MLQQTHARPLAHFRCEQPITGVLRWISAQKPPRRLVPEAACLPCDGCVPQPIRGRAGRTWRMLLTWTNQRRRSENLTFYGQRQRDARAHKSGASAPVMLHSPTAGAETGSRHHRRHPPAQVRAEPAPPAEPSRPARATHFLSGSEAPTRLSVMKSVLVQGQGQDQGLGLGPEGPPPSAEGPLKQALPLSSGLLRWRSSEGRRTQ